MPLEKVEGRSDSATGRTSRGPWRGDVLECEFRGNVMEWCSDLMGRYPKELQTDPYRQSLMGPRRAARGGAMCSNASFVRVATRMGWVADDRCNNIGFRVAGSK